MAANPLTPSEGGLEADIMAFLDNDPVVVEDYLLERNSIHGEDNNQHLPPPHVSSTESLMSSRRDKKKSSSKRQRVPHVHNSSEQRRRKRISERIKALQLLIPSSKKTDTASILDEAIKYVKQLQLQLESCMNIMSMGYMGMGMGTNNIPWQWNNGFMSMPQGLQAQTIPLWANQQMKEYFDRESLPMINKISETGREYFRAPMFPNNSYSYSA